MLLSVMTYETKKPNCNNTNLATINLNIMLKNKPTIMETKNKPGQMQIESFVHRKLTQTNIDILDGVHYYEIWRISSI